MINNYQFAPVLIPTLCRYVHFKRCIESLSLCTGAKETELYIALDYPLKHDHWSGYEKIKKYIPTIVGFAKIIVIERKVNLGAVSNYKDALKEVLKKYDRYIFSEDDNEFSPNFLEFINKGLDSWNNEKRIFAVCGSNYPMNYPETYSYNYFFAKEFLAWGYGSWKDRFESYQNQVNLSYMYYTFNRHIKEFKFNNLLTGTILNFCSWNGSITDDTLMTLKMIDENLLCVFPYNTLVRNWGHDGSGLHCDASNRGVEKFTNREIDSDIEFIYDKGVQMKEEILIRNAINKYFTVSLKYKFRAILALIYYYCFLSIKIKFVIKK